MKNFEDLRALFLKIAQLGQNEYDQWSQDDTGYDVEVGHGGICHLIADQIVNFLNNHEIEAVTHSLDSEVHVLVIVKLIDGIYSLDIPYQYYETGGGYIWKKKSDVIFTENFVTSNKISSKLEDFNNYID